MKKSSPVHRLTDELLRDYTAAALSNAEQLTQEAQLLLAHGHHARAYFLAVAAIEECGKAYTTHEGRGRDLTNPAIANRLQKSIADHQQKLNAATLPWIRRMANPRDQILPLVEVIVALQNGREPSMYSDIRFDGSGVHKPSDVVRPEVAANCVRFCVDIWKHTAAFLAETAPTPYSKTHDALFEIRPDKLAAMTNTEDFAAYLLSRLEGGDMDTTAAFVAYHRDYFQKGIQFQTTTGQAEESGRGAS
ncbi:AbiV family abortive infection protein [Mitsuaria sp. BK045]|uniref:AbiV family abortive infection protein n=1 Tax=unclassified Roseateles TaxID=2626991 RepID=UPI001618DEB7|nr:MULTISPECIES: AbiV family abortive infection protein [unclassified Roseateles]MBB3295099.1 AbiV family abortive infection protein [Mitsuaria sp. BK041]MBB3364315.1 AbiV family abortive infection protein [Mitsuaria sp. BK045]